MAGKNEKYCVYISSSYFSHLSEPFLLLSSRSISSAFSDISAILLSTYTTHMRALTELFSHRTTFASRLRSDFKHPDLHESALCALPPEANFVLYSGAPGLLNSAKLFFIFHRGNISYFFLFLYIYLFIYLFWGRELQ